MSRRKAGVLLLLFLVCVALGGYIGGYYVSRHHFRVEAVQQGIGEFFINEQLERDFRFLTPTMGNVTQDGTGRLPPKIDTPGAD